MHIEWDVPITMDDGLVLRADIFRPPGDAKVPVLLVVGRKEAAERTASMRRLGSPNQTGGPADAVLAALVEEAVAPDLRRTIKAAEVAEAAE